MTSITLIKKRIADYPKQGLSQVDSSLYCNPCSCKVSTDSSACNRHVNSNKHKENIKKWAKLNT